GGNLTLRNSTVTGNTAAFNGGGLGIYGTATVHSSTIASNSALTGSNVTVFQSATFQNTIVAYPQGGVTPTNCEVSGSMFGPATLTSAGNNLEDDSGQSCNFTQSTDQAGPDPNLGALGNNGGPTQTRKPIPPSAAIDKGTASGLIADSAGHVTDQ